MNYHIPYSQLNVPQKIICRNVEIEGKQWHVPIGYIMDDKMKEIVKNTKSKFSYMTKKVTIDDIEYHIPYEWDEVYARNIIKNKVV